jgi:hypothetical protein
MNPENKRPLAPRLGGKSLAMMAAMFGLVEVPAMGSKRPVSPGILNAKRVRAESSSKLRHGKSGNKLLKLADKGGIEMRKHW